MRNGWVRWRTAGWHGWIALDAGLAPHEALAAAASGAGRRSRHARTLRLARPTGVVYVKAYPAPAARRALRALRMGRALAAAGFAVPEAILMGRRRGEGVLVTRDVGGRPLTCAVAALERPAAKRALLRALGAEVARLHAAGFVHGDLVPSNLVVRAGDVVFLDNDRTRRSRLLVWWHARRNLVQLGRFVVPRVTLTDRLRVLAAYAEARGLGRPARDALARWLVRATIARRCRIDGIATEQAAQSGFRELMRSGGPFDAARRAAGAQ